MTYSIDSIINDVRKHIDEIGINEAELVGSQDNVELQTIAREKLRQAIDFVRSQVKIETLNDCDIMHEGEDEVNDYYVTISVPNNLLRFVKAHNSAWKHDVYDVYAANSEEALIAQDEFVGATIYNPVVVADREDNTIVYKLYGRSDTIAQAEQETFYIEYVPKAKIINNLVEFGEKMYDAIVLYTSMLMLSTYNEQTRLQLMTEQFKAIMTNL